MCVFFVRAELFDLVAMIESEFVLRFFFCIVFINFSACGVWFELLRR